MKYIIILGDGMADDPIERLGGRTPLQAARKPNMDRIACEGRCGLLQSIPEGMSPGSEVANLGVMGYDVAAVYQGRGVLEAAAMGVEVGPDEIAMRCNLICAENGRIKNHSAGHISSEEAAELLKAMQAIAPEKLRFHPGVSYRHVFIGHGLEPDLICAPPHDHPDEPLEDLMIKPAVEAARPTAELLNDLTRRSWDILRDHPVNRRRREAGKDPATSIWLWSPGRRPSMWTYKERFGVSGAVISAVDLIRGLGVYAGLETIRVKGATGLYDTNYEGKADAAIEALSRHDFVYVHVEAPDEAGHEGDLELKIRTIEDLDARLVGRLLAALEKKGILAVIAVLPDHPTPVEKRIHVRAPVPFAIRDPRRAPDTVEVYDETACAAGELDLLEGDQFIRAVLEA
jgi:2,3-bisphosphoglycerate-independent phosphoglycerate mutase